MATVIGYITPLGIKINEKKLLTRLGDRAKLNKVLKSLTVKEKPLPGRPRTYNTRTAYRRIDGSIYIPKAKADLFLKNKILNEIKQSKNYSIPVSRTIDDSKWEIARPFYDYQVIAAEYIVENRYSKNPGHEVQYVHMDTGVGKTCFSIAVASMLKGPTFVVAPTDKLRNDWIDEFRTVFPNLIVNAYKNLPKNLSVNSKKKEFNSTNSDIVVGVINTVCKKDVGFFEGYRLVIIDEAHELYSPTKMDLLWLLQEAEHILMLSATPDSAIHGLDKIVYHFAGKPLYAATEIPGINIDKSIFNGRVREINYHGHPDYCEIVLSEAGTINSMGTIGNLLADPHRLQLVVHEIKQTYYAHNTLTSDKLLEMGIGPRPANVASDKFPEGEIRTHSIFVFAELRSYLTVLRDELLKSFAADEIDTPELRDDVILPDGPVIRDDVILPDGPTIRDDVILPDGPTIREDVGVLRGGASAKDCASAKHARIVLTTYGYSRRGVSLTNMTTLILASPRRNGLHQIVGRITRSGSDQSIIRQVIDIKDMCSPLKNQNSERRKVYKDRKYPIYMVEHDYDGDLKDLPGIGDEKLVIAARRPLPL